MLFPQCWKLMDHVHSTVRASRSVSRSGLDLWTLQEVVWTQEHQTGLPMMGMSQKTGRENKPTPFLPKIYQKMNMGQHWPGKLLHGLGRLWKLLNEYMELFMLLEIPAAKNVQQDSTLYGNVQNTSGILSKSALYAAVIFFCFFTFTSWVKDAFPQDRASSR